MRLLRVHLTWMRPCLGPRRRLGKPPRYCDHRTHRLLLVTRGDQVLPLRAWQKFALIQGTYDPEAVGRPPLFLSVIFTTPSLFVCRPGLDARSVDVHVCILTITCYITLHFRLSLAADERISRKPDVPERGILFMNPLL